MSVHIKPEEVPDHVMKYLARDTLAAIRRFYAVPENRERFERWGRPSGTKKPLKRACKGK